MAGKSNPHDVKLNEIVVQDVKGKSIVYDREMMDVLKATVAEYATDAELLMFANVAAKYGLDPFAKEIWFIKYPAKDGGKAKTRIETSRDGYLNIAKRDPNFKGVQSFVVYKEDTFEVDIEGAEVKNVIHKFNGFLERGEVVGAWAVAEKEGQRPVYAVVPFNEYNSGKSTWKSNPSAMIKKVAESDVLKRIGGISGLVTHEEMGDMPQISNNKTKELKEASEPKEDVDTIDAEYEVKQVDNNKTTMDTPLSPEQLADLTESHIALKKSIEAIEKEEDEPLLTIQSIMKKNFELKQDGKISGDDRTIADKIVLELRG